MAITERIPAAGLVAGDTIQWSSGHTAEVTKVSPPSRRTHNVGFRVRPIDYPSQTGRPTEAYCVDEGRPMMKVVG